MEAKELMIGDWVRLKLSQHDTKVTNIGGSYVFTKAVRPIRYDEIEPVPLTPEILEKNGFKKYDELYRLDITEGTFVNVDFKSKEPFVSVHNTCYRATPICRYLHQLQHALRLCGIEKEITL